VSVVLRRWEAVLLAAVLAGSSACATIDTGPGSMSARREVSRARLLAREIDADVSANRLKSRRESAECDGGAVRMQATLFTDSAGRPRKYVLEGRAGDAAHYIFYYYDAAGALRLIDSDQRSGKSSQRTSHVYFDARGKPVHKDERASGPRATFSEATERRDPKADIDAIADPDSGCRRGPWRE
jgi:hypothetical protein